MSGKSPTSGTDVAEVAQVSVAASGKVELERVWCAVDPGRVVHPDGAVNQAEGAIQQAASWTLLEELRHRDGRVAPASFGDYPIATFRRARPYAPAFPGGSVRRAPFRLKPRSRT